MAETATMREATLRVAVSGVRGTGAGAGLGVEGNWAKAGGTAVRRASRASASVRGRGMVGLR